jgi:hypothetical protein
MQVVKEGFAEPWGPVATEAVEAIVTTNSELVVRSPLGPAYVVVECTSYSGPNMRARNHIFHVVVGPRGKALIADNKIDNVSVLEAYFETWDDFGSVYDAF